MPTGYTAPVADGTVTTLREFALRCARAMGATIMMREEPLDAQIPERFEPSSWHADQLADAIARRAELEAMTPEEREAAAATWNAENDATRAKVLTDTTERRNRYNAMLAKVVEWKGAPEGLKEFMLRQLRESRDFDCSDDPLKYYPVQRATEEWFAAEIKEAERRIAYHTKEHAEEVERTEARNAWLAQLRASLPPEDARHD